MEPNEYSDLLQIEEQLQNLTIEPVSEREIDFFI